MSSYPKLARSMLLGGMLATVAACAQQQSAPTTVDAGGWQQRCALMQQQCVDMHAAKTPEERQKAMEQHWRLMRDNKMMMPGACPMGMMDGGPGMAPGMMGHGMGPAMMEHGAMGGSLSAEQLDQRIQHVEAVLEQLKEQRSGMSR